MTKGLKATKNQWGSSVKGDGRNVIRAFPALMLGLNFLKSKMANQEEAIEASKEQLKDKIKEVNSSIGEARELFEKNVTKIKENLKVKEETIAETIKRLRELNQDVLGLGGRVDSLNGNIRIQLGKVDSIVNSSQESDKIPDQVHAVLIDDRDNAGTVDMLVSWNSDRVEKYSHGEVWYIVEPTPLSDAKSATWQKVVSENRKNSVIIPNVKRGEMYLIRVIAVNTRGEKSIQENSPTYRHQVIGLGLVPPPPNLFELSWNKGIPLWEWRQPDNTVYSWTELRTNKKVGEDDGLLDRTLSCKSNAIPPERTATVYLYNKGSGSYAEPLKKTYVKPVPSAPRHVSTETVFEGIIVKYDAVPEDCTGVIVFVNGERYETKESQFLYNCAVGTYTIEVAFYDIYGDGIHSEPITVEQGRKIEKTNIEDGAIESPHIAANAVVSGKISANAIGSDQIQANAISGKHIQAGSILADKIAAKTITSEQIAPKAVKADNIDAKAITAEKLGVGSVTTDTIASQAIVSDKLAANSITGEKIKSNSISADKINVDSLSALSAKIGVLRTKDSGARLEIRDNLITIYDDRGQLRVKMGVW